MNNNQTNIMRYHIADYLNVGTAENEDYKLCGVGFSSLNESPSAEEDEKIYINMKSASTKVKSYKTEFSFEAELIKEEEATMWLYDVGRNHKTGSDAMTDYVRVELFRPIEGEENTFTARKFKVSAIISENAGEGGEPLQTTGSLKAVGDFIDGKFNTSTRTFTSTEENIENTENNENTGE